MGRQTSLYANIYSEMMQCKIRIAINDQLKSRGITLSPEIMNAASKDVFNALKDQLTGSWDQVVSFEMKPDGSYANPKMHERLWEEGYDALPRPDSHLTIPVPDRAWVAVVNGQTNCERCNEKSDGVFLYKNGKRLCAECNGELYAS